MAVEGERLIRVGHVSDLHVLSREGHGPRDYLNKRLLGSANVLLNRRQNYRNDVAFSVLGALGARPDVDHVCVTGDLTSLGLEAEFSVAKRLVGSLEQGPLNVSIIPGNHDRYTRDNARARDFERVFADYLVSDLDVGGDPFPVVKIRQDAAYIGLSSGVASGWLLAYGELGPLQLEALERALVHPSLEGKARVVLLHHPPVTQSSMPRLRSLVDADKLADVLTRAGAELVLHGHEHNDLAYDLTGPGGSKIPVRGVPAGSYVGKHEYRHARYHVYHLQKSAGADGGRPQLIDREVFVFQDGKSELHYANPTPLGREELRT